MKRFEDWNQPGVQAVATSIPQHTCYLDPCLVIIDR